MQRASFVLAYKKKSTAFYDQQVTPTEQSMVLASILGTIVP